MPTLEELYPQMTEQITTARKAKYSDKEIMAKLRGMEEKAVSSGYTQDEIDAHLGRKYIDTTHPRFGEAFGTVLKAGVHEGAQGVRDLMAKPSQMLGEITQSPEGQEFLGKNMLTQLGDLATNLPSTQLVLSTIARGLEKFTGNEPGAFKETIQRPLGPKSQAGVLTGAPGLVTWGPDLAMQAVGRATQLEPPPVGPRGVFAQKGPIVSGVKAATGVDPTEEGWALKALKGYAGAVGENPLLTAAVTGMIGGQALGGVRSLVGGAKRIAKGMKGPPKPPKPVGPSQVIPKVTSIRQPSPVTAQEVVSQFESLWDTPAYERQGGLQDRTRVGLEEIKRSPPERTILGSAYPPVVRQPPPPRTPGPMGPAPTPYPVNQPPGIPREPPGPRNVGGMPYVPDWTMNERPPPRGQLPPGPGPQGELPSAEPNWVKILRLGEEGAIPFPRPGEGGAIHIPEQQGQRLLPGPRVPQPNTGQLTELASEAVLPKVAGTPSPQQILFDESRRAVGPQMPGWKNTGEQLVQESRRPHGKPGGGGGPPGRPPPSGGAPIVQESALSRVTGAPKKVEPKGQIVRAEPEEGFEGRDQRFEHEPVEERARRIERENKRLRLLDPDIPGVLGKKGEVYFGQRGVSTGDAIGKATTVFSIDAHNFKRVNTRIGFDEGTEVLAEAVKILKSLAAPIGREGIKVRGVVSRTHGDEFTLTTHIPVDKAEGIARELETEINRRLKKFTDSKGYPEVTMDIAHATIEPSKTKRLPPELASVTKEVFKDSKNNLRDLQKQRHGEQGDPQRGEEALVPPVEPVKEVTRPKGEEPVQKPVEPAPRIEEKPVGSMIKDFEDAKTGAYGKAPSTVEKKGAQENYQEWHLDKWLTEQFADEGKRAEVKAKIQAALKEDPGLADKGWPAIADSLDLWKPAAEDGLSPEAWGNIGRKAGREGHPFEPPEVPQKGLSGERGARMDAARMAYTEGFNQGKSEAPIPTVKPIKEGEAKAPVEPVKAEPPAEPKKPVVEEPEVDVKSLEGRDPHDMTLREFVAFRGKKQLESLWKAIDYQKRKREGGFEGWEKDRDGKIKEYEAAIKKMEDVLRLKADFPADMKAEWRDAVKQAIKEGKQLSPYVLKDLASVAFIDKPVEPVAPKVKGKAKGKKPIGSWGSPVIEPHAYPVGTLPPHEAPSAKIMKQQKVYLLEHVRAAIKDAPDVAPTGKNAKVVIHVPGDGKFTIPNRKNALQAFEKMAKTDFPETIGKFGFGGQKGAKRTGKRIVTHTRNDAYVEYASEYMQREVKEGEYFPMDAKPGQASSMIEVGDWISNGQYLLKKTPEFEMDWEGIEKRTSQGVLDGMKDMVAEIKNPKNARAAEIIGEYGEEATTHVLLKSEGDAVLLDPDYVDLVQSRYPDAEPFFTEVGPASNIPMVGWKKGGETVAGIAGKVVDQAEAPSIVKDWFGKRVEGLNWLKKKLGDETGAITFDFPTATERKWKLAARRAMKALEEEYGGKSRVKHLPRGDLANPAQMNAEMDAAMDVLIRYDLPREFAEQLAKNPDWLAQDIELPMGKEVSRYFTDVWLKTRYPEVDPSSYAKQDLRWRFALSKAGHTPASLLKGSLKAAEKFAEAKAGEGSVIPIERGREKTRNLFFDEKGSIEFGKKTPVEKKFDKAMERMRAADKEATKKHLTRFTERLKPETQEKIAQAVEEQGTVPLATTKKKAKEAIAEELYTEIPHSPNSHAAHAFLKSRNFQDYLDGMPDLEELKPSEVRGKPGVVDVRESGQYVHTSFLKQFISVVKGEESHIIGKDISKYTKQTMDISRIAELIDDGELGGQVTQKIVWPARDTIRARLLYEFQRKETIDDLATKYKIDSNRKEVLAWEILGGQKPKAPQEIYRFVVEARRIFDRMREDQNAARAKRGQEPIPYRENYVTWMVRDTMMNKILGQRTRPEGILEQAGMPDFIQPNKPFNPRELPREAKYERYIKDKRVLKLMSDYAGTAGRDIFNTNIIHNNKVHAKFLKDSAGRPNAADAIMGWTSEVFAHVPHAWDKGLNEIAPPVSWALGAQRKLRHNLMRSVFPLNWAWNLVTQTNANIMLLPRVGLANAVKGMKVFTDPRIRAIVDQTYAHVMKSSQNPEVAAFKETIAKFKRLDKEPFLDRVADRMNFLTIFVEKNFTDQAIAAGYFHGKQLGLKGRALLEYAGDTGARVQGMYNLEDLPGLLRSKEVKGMFPLQTFAFEAMNNLREIVGGTGPYKGLSKKIRFGRILKLEAGIIAANALSDYFTGRDSWSALTFLPFGAPLASLAGFQTENVRYGAYQPVAIQAVNDARKAFRDVYYYDDWREARKTFFRFGGVPGGVPIERAIEGWEATEKGGVFDVKGKRQFPVKRDSKLWSMMFGPHSSEGARKEREKKAPTTLEMLIGGKKPKHVDPITPEGMRRKMREDLRKDLR